MKRLNERDTTMSETMSRRSILKYAAAMGAALVLPTGVAKALDDKTSTVVDIPSNEELEPVTQEEVAEYSHEQLVQLINDNATSSFRDDFVHIVQKMSLDKLTGWVTGPNWEKHQGRIRDAMHTALSGDIHHADLHAQFVIWAIEARVAGYTPEQCCIRFPRIDGELAMAVVYSAEGESA